jgi:hypothetical protein
MFRPNFGILGRPARIATGFAFCSAATLRCVGFAIGITTQAVPRPTNPHSEESLSYSKDRAHLERIAELEYMRD